jgi:hypothetical protein
MTHITRQMVAGVLNTLDSRFDAHDVEQRLLRGHTVSVARELLEFAHTDDPLHRWSAHTAQWIDQQFRGQIHKTTKVTSKNLGGLESENQEWQKTNPGTPIR